MAPGEQLGGLLQALRPAGPRSTRIGLGIVAVDLAIEHVARDVELGRPALEHRIVEAARRAVRRCAPGCGTWTWYLVIFEKNGSCSVSWKPPRPCVLRAGLRRDHHDRRMRPIGGGDRGDEIGDARAVLGDADALLARAARVAVGHVAGALLVRHRDEADAGRPEQVERVHIGRADDAEDMGDALRHQGLDEGFRRRHGGGLELSVEQRPAAGAGAVDDGHGCLPGRLALIGEGRPCSWRSRLPAERRQKTFELNNV